MREREGEGEEEGKKAERLVDDVSLSTGLSPTPDGNRIVSCVTVGGSKVRDEVLSSVPRSRLAQMAI